MNELIFTRMDFTSNALQSALLLIGMSLLCGAIIAVVYRLGTDRPSKYMVISTLIVPSIVQAVIMMVNGSIGAGVAAAGAFSLVRFRSLPGSSRDICILFFAMASGLICGMGYAWYAVLFTVILAIVIIAAERLIPPHGKASMRLLKIIIPEDMDYSSAFDDIFKEYTVSCKLDHVKTIRMGTMYELFYIITFRSGASEKEMLDKIRCRNGNLSISCGLIPDIKDEL